MLKSRSARPQRVRRRGGTDRTSRSRLSFSIVLGKRISPSSISNIRGVPLNVEPLSDARTKPAEFFSILLEIGLHDDGSDSFTLGRSDPCKLEAEHSAVDPPHQGFVDAQRPFLVVKKQG